MPVVKNSSGLVVEGPAAALACVPPDVSMVSAVPDDINPAATRAEQAVGPPDRPEQLGCSRHIDKQCQQEQQGAGFFLFLHLATRHGGMEGSTNTDLFRLYLLGAGLHLPPTLNR